MGDSKYSICWVLLDSDYICFCFFQDLLRMYQKIFSLNLEYLKYFIQGIRSPKSPEPWDISAVL